MHSILRPIILKNKYLFDETIIYDIIRVSKNVLIILAKQLSNRNDGSFAML